MPVKALHAVEGGLCKDVAAILFKQDLKDASCGRLDVLVQRFGSMDKQHYMTSSSNKAMPHILFKDGVTSLAKLPSSHVVGILLTIVIVSLTDEGISLFKEVFRPVGSKTGGTEHLNNMRYAFLMMLSYWSWLKQDYYWECGDRVEQKRAATAIRTMLEELIKFCWSRGEGDGWFKAKVHEQLHVPGDISRNGSPRNTYTGPVENNHLDVKEQAMRSQMNRSLLDEQIGNRSAEAYIMN
jgi:hypothetical protein